MSEAAEILAELRRSAVELGDAYSQAIAADDNARALACAQRLLVRFSEAIPDEDEFNNAHRLLLNLLIALREIGAGRLHDHPILIGRHVDGGISQLGTSQELRNGLGTGVMLFLLDHGVSEHRAATIVSKPLGVGLTAAKNWLAAPRRKLLKAFAIESLNRIKAEFDQSSSRDAVQFAERWLPEQLKAMVALSPR